MKAIYVRTGDVLEIVATGAVARGDLVPVSGGACVAVDDIPAGGAGLVHCVGVFSVPKKANEAIDAGAKLYLDDTNDCVTKVQGALTVVAGIAAAPALASALTVDVRLTHSV